jgi:hypothetical protein
MVLITIVNGVYKPTYNWGAPPCMFKNMFVSLSLLFCGLPSSVVRSSLTGNKTSDQGILVLI